MRNAYKCFDGCISEEENLKMAEVYWSNGENEDGHREFMHELPYLLYNIYRVLRDKKGTR